MYVSTLGGAIYFVFLFFIQILPFFEDETYKVFIEDMRNLLKNEKEFKERYCEVNHISSRENEVQDEPGDITYIKVKKD